MKHVTRIVLFGLLCAGLWCGQQAAGLQLDPATLRSVDHAGSWQWVGAYLAFWLLANSVLWPTLAGGVLFGWVGGASLSVIGAVASAAVQLMVFRTFLREPAEAWLGDRLAPLQARLEERSLAVLVVWRLLWLPVPVITVAAALTRIPVWQHVVSLLAMVPGIIALTWMADGLVTRGLWALPWERWALLGAAFGFSLAGYALAQHRWPALRLLQVARP